MLEGFCVRFSRFHEVKRRSLNYNYFLFFIYFMNNHTEGSALKLITVKFKCCHIATSFLSIPRSQKEFLLRPFVLILKQRSV
jgi:hypothetical protein